MEVREDERRLTKASCEICHQAVPALDDLSEKATPEEKMDLSIRRAQAVADYLTKHGVESEIIRVQGCSTFEPIIQRDYQIGAQAKNRRVEVEATSTLVQERQDLSAKKEVVQ